MICTSCHQDDGLDQDFSELPLHVVKLLCKEWLCGECMTEREAIESTASPDSAS